MRHTSGASERARGCNGGEMGQVIPFRRAALVTGGAAEAKDRLAGATAVAGGAQAVSRPRSHQEALVEVERIVRDDVAQQLTVTLGYLELVLAGRAGSPAQAQEWLHQARCAGGRLMRAFTEIRGICQGGVDGDRL